MNQAPEVFWFIVTMRRTEDAQPMVHHWSCPHFDAWANDEASDRYGAKSYEAAQRLATRAGELRDCSTCKPVEMTQAGA
jgi:hypothetical protein